MDLLIALQRVANKTIKYIAKILNIMVNFSKQFNYYVVVAPHMYLTLRSFSYNNSLKCFTKIIKVYIKLNSFNSRITMLALLLEYILLNVISILH